MSWPGGLRHRTVLAPARHASVDELRVAGEARVGTEAEPLGDAGPEALEQRVGALDEPQHELDAVGVLQVDADRAAAAVQRLEVRLVELRRVDLLRAVDADDVGAHVRQQHPGERPRSDPGQLDDLDSCKRSHACKLHAAKRRPHTGLGASRLPLRPVERVNLRRQHASRTLSVSS